MARNIFKWLGGQFVNLGLDTVLAALVSFISLSIGSNWTVSNWPLFVLIWLIVVVILQIIGRFFLWLSNQFVYLDIIEVNDEPHHCNIKIRNRFGADLTDFRMELKRLHIVGYPTDCDVRNTNPFFSSGIRIDNKTIKKDDTATIHITEIPPAYETRYFMEFLIDGGWKSTHRYEDISNELEERKKSLGPLAGTMYEFVIEITGKIGNDYIKPQVYRGRMLYLSVYYQGENKPDIQWIRLDKYSMRKEARRNKGGKFHFYQEIKSKEDFWKLLGQMKRGEMPSIKKSPQ